MTTLPRALAFGTVWGWMPCGFVYSVLLIAALAADPLQAAGTMLAFGLGTVPAMLATAMGAPQLLRFAGRPHARQTAGAILPACAALTFVALCCRWGMTGTAATVGMVRRCRRRPHSH